MPNKDGSGKGQMAAWKVWQKISEAYELEILTSTNVFDSRHPRYPRNTKKKEATTKMSQDQRISQRQARQNLSPTATRLRIRSPIHPKRTKMTRLPKAQILRTMIKKQMGITRMVMTL